MPVSPLTTSSMLPPAGRRRQLLRSRRLRNGRRNGGITAAQVYRPRRRLGLSVPGLRPVFVNASARGSPASPASPTRHRRSPERRSPSARPKASMSSCPRLTAGPSSHGLFFQARRDGRIMFVFPWHDCTLVGFTDTISEATRPTSAPSRPIRLLLGEALRPAPPLPGVGPPLPVAVLTAFAGVRPLLAPTNATPPPAPARSVRQSAATSCASPAGNTPPTGRLRRMPPTTLFRLLGRRPPPCLTARTAIPYYRPPPAGEAAWPTCRRCTPVTSSKHAAEEWASPWKT